MSGLRLVTRVTAVALAAARTRFGQLFSPPQFVGSRLSNLALPRLGPLSGRDSGTSIASFTF